MQSIVKVQQIIKPQKLSKSTKQKNSDSQQFQLQYHQIKKLGLSFNKKKLRVGNWNPEQNLLYLRFLTKYKSDFNTEQQRRKNKVFHRLSKILRKRTPDQCRSHHQKLQMKYSDNIDEIINCIKKKLQNSNIQGIEADLKKLDNTNFQSNKNINIKENSQKTPYQYSGQFYKFFEDDQGIPNLQIYINKVKTWN